MSIVPMWSHSHRNNRGIVSFAWIGVLVSLVFVIVACSPTEQTPAPSVRPQGTPPAQFQQPPQQRSSAQVPIATQTPTLALTMTPSLAPTTGALVLPTPPANGVTLTLTPDTSQTGWVGSNPKTVFTPDNNLNAGILKGQAFASIIQFDLSSLAPGTKILHAVLELSGRNTSNLGTQGLWAIDVLDTKPAVWTGTTYDALAKLPALFAVNTPLLPNELGAGRRKRFVFSAQQLGSLQKQIDLGALSIRLSGPAQGDDNLFVWDATPGTREPTLYLVLVPALFTLITPEPTPPDIFAAATRSVAQTLQAAKFGTPTPLPRSMATATSLPYVVYTQAPTPVNRAEASATAAYVTAVAMTTGTFTPIPLHWYTATPPPIAVPFSSLTPVPSATPTIAPLSSIELAKRPLPAMLYNKIAFLSGSRENPTAWIIDPDGSNLAQLSDRTYYDIAAARDTISPDGIYQLYNALDKNGILQIWRKKIDSANTLPEQITFHTRGISFSPVWSPDGMKILYTSTKDGREQEIFLFDLNDPHRWPRLSFSSDQYLWNQYPTWSPDGKQIAFSSDRQHISAYTEIWLMSADGSGAKKLGDGSRDAWAPVWIKWLK